MGFVIVDCRFSIGYQHAGRLAANRQFEILNLQFLIAGLPLASAASHQAMEDPGTNGATFKNSLRNGE
jgi:hypothetical protein